MDSFDAVVDGLVNAKKREYAMQLVSDPDGLLTELRANLSEAERSGDSYRLRMWGELVEWVEDYVYSGSTTIPVEGGSV